MEVDRATARLLETAARFSEADVAAPSRLPGWTRGHVLSHLARNADGGVNLLTWARTGVETPQYVSAEARAADIDAGSGRDAATQLADVTAASAALAATAADLPAEAWLVEVKWTSGAAAPAARVMWSRLRELEIHHVDLDAGYTPVHWPSAFTLRLLTGLGKEFTKRDDAVAMVIRCPELGHDIAIGADGPLITGPAWAAAAWLIGRHDGSALSSANGPLPTVPTWG